MDFNFSNMFLPVYKHSGARGQDLSAGANYFRPDLQKGAISQKRIFSQFRELSHSAVWEE
jgi:hypothetical protein